MTSAKGGTFAGQYQRDGSVDNLEPTPFIHMVDFLFYGNNLTINND